MPTRLSERSERGLCPRNFQGEASEGGTAPLRLELHRALGFVISGSVDNLPQGYRELLFYKRVEPVVHP